MKFYKYKIGFFYNRSDPYVMGVEDNKWYRVYLKGETEGKNSDFSYYVNAGYYIEVESWPEGVTNPTILKHMKVDLNKKLSGAAVKVNTKEELNTLMGMYLQAGFVSKIVDYPLSRW